LEGVTLKLKHQGKQEPPGLMSRGVLRFPNERKEPPQVQSDQTLWLTIHS